MMMNLVLKSLIDKNEYSNAYMEDIQYTLYYPICQLDRQITKNSFIQYAKYEVLLTGSCDNMTLNIYSKLYMWTV